MPDLDFTVSQMIDTPPTIPAIFANMDDAISAFQKSAERFISNSKESK